MKFPVLSSLLVLFAPLVSGAGHVDPFNQPMEYKSENGRLQVTLVVDMLESLNGTRVAPAYNGLPCGPTLRVSPGDTLEVTLQNNIAVSDTDRELYDYVYADFSDELNATRIYNRLDMNGNIYNPTYGFWGLNYVNLHFHGLEVSPSIEAMHEYIADGDSKTYTIDIPDDQEPGLHWYHNHAHGNAAYAYLSSLFGFIIVEGTEEDIPKSPGLEDATELLMVFSEELVNEDKSVPPFFPIFFTFNWNSVVNGFLDTETTYTFAQGQTVLFRTVSATVEPVIRFVVPGVKFWIIAYDGYPVPTPMQVEEVPIYAGQRIEFLARFDEPGTFDMVRLGWGNDLVPEPVCEAQFGPNATFPCISYGIDKPVGTIVVEPAANGTMLPTGSVMDGVELPAYSDRLKAFEDMPIADTKSFSFDQARGYPLFQFPFDGVFVPPGTTFGVNGRSGTPLETVGNVTVDTCERWTLTTDGAHPFHAHAGKFYVTSMKNTTVEEVVWRDTFEVNEQNSPVEIKICYDRILPCDMLLLHCHVVSHLDIGMFANLLAVDENGVCDTSTITPVTTALPTDMPTSSPSIDSGTSLIWWSHVGMVLVILSAALIV